jgi:hypothetical protein
MRRRSSADRGYVEPLAALAAVLALGVGLTLYVGTLGDSSATSDGERTAAILDSIVGDAGELGVLSPDALDVRETAAGLSVNLTLETSSTRWTHGVSPPPTADRSSRRVSVRVEPGSVEPGRLRVAVW